MKRTSSTIEKIREHGRRTARELTAAWRYVRDEPADIFAAAVAAGGVVRIDTTLTPERAAAAEARVRERLGSALGRAVGGELAELPVQAERTWPGWSLHCCALEAECREHGAPARIQASTPWAGLVLGLRPGAGIRPGPGDWAGLGPLTITARPEQICARVVVVEWWGERPVSYRTCPLRRGHRRGCLDWRSGERVESCVQEQREV